MVTLLCTTKSVNNTFVVELEKIDLLCGILHHQIVPMLIMTYQWLYTPSADIIHRQCGM